ncbi:MAG: phosphoribosylformylglycinamidine synthase subunit PurS [Leptospirales bacterium]|nr:phosphoribosylformylglycinamidine synthase subunit PurS [Leptospirales bacterium]
MYLARIQIKLKESILDPQGQAVLHALHNLNHREVQDVRIGKFVELLLESRSAEDAEQQVRKYCESLLSNPVIETFEFTIGAAP